MIRLARTVATALAVLALYTASTVRAETSDQAAARLLKHTPVFSQEEMGRTRFSASFSTNYSVPMLEYAFYNPHRDRGIIGLVVTIQPEKEGAQEPAFDLFISVECGPLQCRANQHSVPVLRMEQIKRSSSIVLKEVHYTPLIQVDDASR